MSDYKRLTKWEIPNCASVNGCSPIDKEMANAINSLAELEDKIENGKLAEVNRGKWKVMQTVVIRTEGRPTYSETYQCSVCGEWNDKKQNFCPNCGAKMDLEEE